MPGFQRVITVLVVSAAVCALGLVLSACGYAVYLAWTWGG